jgi:RNA polymerase sigma factor (sigma-70 family)
MDAAGHTGRKFKLTRWSVVLAAAEEASPQAQEALATLCQTYWYPLYAYIRHQGYPPHDAQDLTQEFFFKLLQKRYLAGIQREGGKFRSFLLTALKRFLANEWDRARAQKRGGRHTVVSIDGDAAESRYRLEPAHELTAEKIYEQRWAQALLDRVFGRLREDYHQAGKQNLFDLISPSLSRSRDAMPYAQIAARLGVTEAAVKMAVKRLRARYRELLRAEIAPTVASPEEVEEEIRHLFAAFSG